jgi:hypothetical protein
VKLSNFAVGQQEHQIQPLQLELQGRTRQNRSIVRIASLNLCHVSSKACQVGINQQMHWLVPNKLKYEWEMDLDRLIPVLQLAMQRREQHSAGKRIRTFLSQSESLSDCSQLQTLFLEVS